MSSLIGNSFNIYNLTIGNMNYTDQCFTSLKQFKYYPNQYNTMAETKFYQNLGYFSIFNKIINFYYNLKVPLTFLYFNQTIAPVNNMIDYMPVNDTFTVMKGPLTAIDHVNTMKYDL